MKWFKHESAANMDAKLQEVLLDYGLEGYGLYWYCLELVAGNVEPESLTFELEHDCRVIARNTGSTAQRVQEMMTRFVELGLFENSQGTITCLRMAKVSDDYTAKLIRSRQAEKKSQAIEAKEVRQTPTNSDKNSLEENRTEQNKSEQSRTDENTNSSTSVERSNSGSDFSLSHQHTETPDHFPDAGKMIEPTSQPNTKKPKTSTRRQTKAEATFERIRTEFAGSPLANLPDDLLADWIRHKKNSPGDRMIAGMNRELGYCIDAGINPGDAVLKQLEQGWTGLEANWIIRERNSTSLTNKQSEHPIVTGKHAVTR